MVSSTPRPHFTPGKEPVPIVREAGWATGPVWTGGKSRPHRDLIPDRPARSQSLYLLSYPAHLFYIPCSKKYVILGKITLRRKKAKLSHYDKNSQEIIPDVMTSLRLTSTSPKRVQISGTTLTPHRSSCCSVALARDT